ncbi:hypothetical protein HMPREF1050_1650 [Haemophilus parahaemolyticus HK385]|uniref:Uncharacterized protein n=1 Tax=Haemophilus parahaemolyticus HK385 TaxID=1095744 RepID=A0ABP2P3C4_HAEPH|nr:hypothetical protein HMPREF1050_1650 [Haemophilus parahaemolyticus HK385]
MHNPPLNAKFKNLGETQGFFVLIRKVCLMLFMRYLHRKAVIFSLNFAILMLNITA